MRSYDDPCGIARALDHLGERWALLIVRELSFGPKRFTDLKAGLPQASPNVLSQRLDDLEASGIVTKQRLTRPASGEAYQLTERGQTLHPVLLELGRWGRALRPIPDGELSVDALLLALQTTFQPAQSTDLIVNVELDGQQFIVWVAEQQLAIEAGVATNADLEVRTSIAKLRKQAFSGQPSGEPRLDQFLAAFRPQ